MKMIFIGYFLALAGIIIMLNASSSEIRKAQNNIDISPGNTVVYNYKNLNGDQVMTRMSWSEFSFRMERPIQTKEEMKEYVDKIQ